MPTKPILRRRQLHKLRRLMRNLQLLLKHQLPILLKRLPLPERNQTHLPTLLPHWLLRREQPMLPMPARRSLLLNDQQHSLQHNLRLKLLPPRNNRRHPTRPMRSNLPDPLLREPRDKRLQPLQRGVLGMHRLPSMHAVRPQPQLPQTNRGLGHLPPKLPAGQLRAELHLFKLQLPVPELPELDLLLLLRAGIFLGHQP